MPNIKSAIKRVKVTDKKRANNRVVKSGIKVALKNFDNAIASKDEANIAETYKKAAATIDRAASKGTVHKNAANRKKSRLAIRANKEKLAN